MKKQKMWEIKQQAEKADTLQLYIYGDVEADYFDWWNWTNVESETSANHFRDVLNKYPDVSEIEIYINSYGGSVYEGTAIYNQLKRHKAHKTVYIDGFACSIASVIAMAGDEVIMPKNALMMIHNMWMSTAGNAAQLRKAADDLDIINAAGRGAYLDRIGDKLSEEKLIEMMDAETWLTAEQCIEYGFADKYAEKDADITDMKALLQKANLDISQQLDLRKSLVAQLKEYSGEAKKPEGIPKKKTDEKELEDLGIMGMIAGVF